MGASSIAKDGKLRRTIPLSDACRQFRVGAIANPSVLLFDPARLAAQHRGQRAHQFENIANVTPIQRSDVARIRRAVGRSKHNGEFAFIGKLATAACQFTQHAFPLEVRMNHAVDRLPAQDLLLPIRKWHGPDHVKAHDLPLAKPDDSGANAR